MVKADGCVADPRRRRRVQAAELDERAEHARRRAATAGWSPTPRASAHDHPPRGAARLAPRPRRRPRPAEGRRRGPPPGAARRQLRHAIEDGLRWCAASTRRRSGRSTSSAATPTASVVAVEVKRRGEIDGVEQLARYLERLHLDSVARRRPRGVRRPVDQAAGQVLAEARGFRWVEVDYDELRGIAPDELRLF